MVNNHESIKKLMKKYKLKLQEIPIIVYCYNNSCDASILLANILFSHGYTNILDYEGGIIDFLGRSFDYVLKKIKLDLCSHYKIFLKLDY